MDKMIDAVLKKLPEIDLESLNTKDLDALQDSCDEIIGFLGDAIEGTARTMWWAQSFEESSETEHLRNTVMAIQLLAETMNHLRSLHLQADHAIGFKKLKQEAAS